LKQQLKYLTEAVSSHSLCK